MANKTKQGMALPPTIPPINLSIRLTNRTPEAVRDRPARSMRARRYRARALPISDADVAQVRTGVRLQHRRYGALPNRQSKPHRPPFVLRIRSSFSAPPSKIVTATHPALQGFLFFPPPSLLESKRFQTLDGHQKRHRGRNGEPSCIVVLRWESSAMDSPDQTAILRAVLDARRILAEELNTASSPQIMERLRAVLNRDELVHTLCRMSHKPIIRLDETAVEVRRVASPSEDPLDGHAKTRR